MSKFIISKSANGDFRFKLNAGNGETILSSEAYTTRAACDNGIESVKTNAPNDGRYAKETAKDGRAYFNLKAGNGQIIGTSQMYSSTAARDGGIESVKKNAPDAEVVEA
jgi:uncharacterized protein YegP (UPF0339 family)